MTAFISTAKRYNHASPDILAVLLLLLLLLLLWFYGSRLWGGIEEIFGPISEAAAVRDDSSD